MYGNTKRREEERPMPSSKRLRADNDDGCYSTILVVKIRDLREFGFMGAVKLGARHCACVNINGARCGRFSEVACFTAALIKM